MTGLLITAGMTLRRPRPGHEQWSGMRFGSRWPIMVAMSSLGPLASSGAFEFRVDVCQSLDTSFMWSTSGRGRWQEVISPWFVFR
jgi:hypothetical protein